MYWKVTMTDEKFVVTVDKADMQAAVDIFIGNGVDPSSITTAFNPDPNTVNVWVEKEKRKMLDVKINTPEGSIRLNLDGLVLRQGDTYVFLTRQEYMWLPVHHNRGQNLTITSEGGEVTLMPNIAEALVSLIKEYVDY